MPILYGGSKVKEIYYGQSSVSKIYYGTSLVWQKDYPYYFWNNGTQNGYAWRASSPGEVGNDTTTAAAKLVPMGNYSWHMAADAGYADGNGVSTLRIRTIGTTSSKYLYKAEIQTTTGLTITAQHKYLNISIRRLGGTQHDNECFFGLYKSGCTDYNKPNGHGVCNADALSLTSTNFATYSIAIPSSLVGNTYHFNLFGGIYKPSATGQGFSCQSAWISYALPSGSTLLTNTTTT